MGPNMEYCKFENTVSAMEQCLDNMPDSLEGMSSYERSAYKRFLELLVENSWYAEELLEELEENE